MGGRWSPSWNKSAPSAKPKWAGSPNTSSFRLPRSYSGSRGLHGPQRVADARVSRLVANSADTACRIAAGHHRVVVSASVVRVRDLYRVGLLVARTVRIPSHDRKSYEFIRDCTIYVSYRRRGTGTIGLRQREFPNCIAIMHLTHNTDHG